MAERVDEKTEREIEALLDKLIVQKVCAGVEAGLESQGQGLSKKLEKEREKVESALNFQGIVMEECGSKLDTLSADGKRLDEKLDTLSQGGERLREKLDNLTKSEKRLEEMLDKEKAVLEEKLTDVVQAVSAQAEAGRTQAEDFRKEDKDRWERLFREQEDKFRKLWHVMAVLFCLQLVGIVLAIAQLMR